MNEQYIISLIKQYALDNKIVWYMQSDGTFTSVYKVGDNEFYLSIYKDHRSLIILKIALKNIMRADIMQKDAVIWPDSPADKLFKKFRKQDELSPKRPEDTYNSDLEAIYKKASSSALKPDQSREILFKLLSGL